MHRENALIYADMDYYRNTYLGKFDDSDEELTKMLGIASRKIDGLTFNRVAAYGFDNLTDYQKESLRQACCFQMDYLVENGIDGNCGNKLSGYSVGDVRVNVSKDTSSAGRAGFSQTAYEMVECSGLMSRGV